MTHVFNQLDADRMRSIDRKRRPIAVSCGLAISLAAVAVLALAFAPRAEAFVYWANDSGTTIGRAALDGTGANQSFVTGASNPCGVAVDPAHLYWASDVPSGTIGRANLTGTGVNQSFIGGAASPCGVAVDAAHLYWANIDNGTIGRANLDGTGVNQSFIAGASLPCGVAVDAAHLYWASLVDGTIGRANLDGTGVDQSFIAGATVPCGVAVDAGHVYWANGPPGDTIGRADLDGGNPNQFFIDGGSGPCGVAVDGGHVYWANGGNGTIGRANLDGTGVSQSFIAGANGPCGVAVDALDTGYPRPKGAPQIRVSLVPAYRPCDAPNRTHGPSLSSPSCTPPVQASSFLTVGTADSNGAATQSVASVVLASLLGNPATPADEADIKLTASAIDVRLKAGLGDYTGELQANARLRLLDRASGPALNEPATVQDFIYRFTVPCRTTVSTTIGSTCAVTTTADAIQPGTVRERARTIWHVGQVQLLDGGPDGVAATTTGNTLFETQGVFVP
jgi:virginiamycin B lyase